MKNGQWQNYLIKHLHQFDCMSLMYLLKHLHIDYVFNDRPHFHFTGNEIAAITFSNQQAKIDKYSLSFLGIDSLFPVYLSQQYWQKERQREFNIYFLILKILETRYLQNVLSAETLYKSCLNPKPFNRSMTALIGSKADPKAVSDLLLKYSAHAVKKNISEQNLMILLNDALDAETTIRTENLTYRLLEADQCSRLKGEFRQLAKNLLLGKGIYQAHAKITIEIKLKLQEYSRFVLNQAELKTLIRSIRRLIKKTIPIELKLLLRPEDRPALSLGKQQLGQFSWLKGQPIFDSPIIIKEQ